MQAHSNHSLFIKRAGDTLTVLIVYVDDIVLKGNSLSEINAVKEVLQSWFGIKDLGVLKYFLGLDVAHSSKRIYLCQTQYCLDLLNDSGMLGSKPTSSPLQPGTHLYQDDSPLYDDAAGCRRLIGRLIYLTNTRPDICFATKCPQISQRSPWSWSILLAVCLFTPYGLF